MKWIGFAFLFVYGISAEESKFVYTPEMASQCKEHLSRLGYQYDKVYSIKADLQSKSFQGKSNAIFEMHIAIQASSNGHIMLSSVPRPRIDDRVYEIVVGGGDNNFTEIRHNFKRNAKVSRFTRNILSQDELRGFYIKIFLSTETVQARRIEFGQEGPDSSQLLLNYIDLSPLDIQYFSFAAWSGVEAKFLYDCPAPSKSEAGSNVTVIQHSKKIERNLTASEQLRKEKLLDRSPYIPPNPVVPVSVKTKITGVSFNAFEAKLTTRMTILTKWEDKYLAWSPDKFGNLTSIAYRQGQIWRPTLHVYNSDNLDDLATSGYELISVDLNGSASFHFKATLETWCYADDTNDNRWPRDDYDCLIVFQAWQAHETMLLTILSEEDAASVFTEDDNFIENEWKLLEVRQSIVSNAIWNKLYPMQINSTHQTDRLLVRLKLERQSTKYNMAFYTPLIVLMTFVLMSFWSEPLKMSRVWFYAGTTVTVSAGLCFVDYLIPCHTVPSILVLYITVLHGVLAALVLQVLMMTAVAEEMCKSTVMKKVLSIRWLRVLFCLPVAKVCSNYDRVIEDQSEEDDQDSVFAPNGNVEEMSSEATKVEEREELAEVLDKTMFFVYSVLFAAMLAAHY